MAVGGSTNAVVHLLAIAGRTRHKLVLDDFDTISRRTPFLVNVRPSGQHMMEDFFYRGRRAGGDARTSAAAAPRLL